LTPIDRASAPQTPVDRSALESYRDGEGFRLERYLIFATARRPQRWEMDVWT